MNPNLKELQELIDFLFELPATYEKVKADGKVDFADLQYALPLFLSAKAGIEGVGNPLKRWRALSAAEKAIVIGNVKANFFLSDNALEGLIERWFETGVMLAELVADTVAYTKKPAADEPAA